MPSLLTSDPGAYKGSGRPGSQGGQNQASPSTTDGDFGDQIPGPAKKHDVVFNTSPTSPNLSRKGERQVERKERKERDGRKRWVGGREEERKAGRKTKKRGCILGWMNSKVFPPLIILL